MRATGAVLCLSLSCLAALSAGCQTSRGASGSEAFATDVPLVPGVAAAIAAGAVQQTLARPDAPAHPAGAPATRRADGSFTIAVAADGAGGYRWLGSERLTIRVLDGEPAARVVRTPSTRATAADAGGPADLWLAVAPRGAASATHHATATIRGWLPRPIASRVRAALDRAFALATSRDATAPGLMEPNLAAWRLSQLLAAAASEPDDAARGDLLRRAARLPGAPPDVHAQLAALDANGGNLDRALDHFEVAMLTARDPAQRAALAARAASAAANERPATLRSVARRRLRDGEPQAAETLLHSARRAARSPALDYQLLGRVHRRRGDPMAALAAELLAREHQPQLAAPLGRWPAQLADWTARLVRDIEPVVATAVRHAVPAMAAPAR